MAGTRESRVLKQMAAARRASLLRFGLEAERKKYFAQAIENYNCLIERYPDSEEGNRARMRLQELGALSADPSSKGLGQ